MYEDRIDAGMQLARALEPYRYKDTVILAIPRGGLPLGTIIAKSLRAPLDIVLTKKIGHPFHKEYAIGAVSMENRILGDAYGVTKNYIEEETKRIRKKLAKRHQKYYENRVPAELKGKSVIIVDDGMATGNTILVTAELIRKKKPKEIVVAVPVAPRSAVAKVKSSNMVDEIICLETPADFYAVGQYYEQFPQVTDQQAIKLLEEGNQNLTPASR